ncbi:MAG: single-stranded DNA-binding protein [Cyanobacteriota bacterium]|nr:single-stranded DNA-binding protein [Cyanobacteriota bacterium]
MRPRSHHRPGQRILLGTANVPLELPVCFYEAGLSAAVEVVVDHKHRQGVAADRLRPRGEEREVQAQWFRVELWARQAEVLGPLLRKGKEVMVHGQLELVGKREGGSAFPAA